LRGTDLGAYSRRRGHWQSGVVEAGGGGRWVLYSDELVAPPEQQAKGGATGDPRAGRSNTRWWCKRPEGGARRGHHWRRQWRLGVWAMRAAASLTPFIGARALWRGSRPSTVWALRRSNQWQPRGGVTWVRRHCGLRCGDAWRHGRGPEGSVWRKWVPPRADRRALAGLGVRARGHRGGARGMAHSGVQGANPFPLNPV
jgi:hypothetical protein